MNLATHLLAQGDQVPLLVSHPDPPGRRIQHLHHAGVPPKDDKTLPAVQDDRRLLSGVMQRKAWMHLGILLLVGVPEPRQWIIKLLRLGDAHRRWITKVPLEDVPLLILPPLHVGEVLQLQAGEVLQLHVVNPRRDHHFQ